MRKINYYELGATLYLPMNHKNVLPILRREKYVDIKSIVLCLEDSVSDEDLPESMMILEELLASSKFDVSSLKVFIRPRGIDNLRKVLLMKNIDLIDGFSIPKFDTDNAAEYLSIFIEKNKFYFMPILESKDVFSSIKLAQIANELVPFKERVLCVRVGSEDILSILNMMRGCDKTIYEIMPLYIILSTIINLFKLKGFNISSPVYSCYENPEILAKELHGDVEHQIFNKTIIHPGQAFVLHDSYKVCKEDYLVAKRLLDGVESVFGARGRMYEKKTHSNWAKSIIEREKHYGIKESIDA